jgi:hypothetical protein
MRKLFPCQSPHRKKKGKGGITNGTITAKNKKELQEIGEKDLTTANVDIAGKLVDIIKDIGEI